MEIKDQLSRSEKLWSFPNKHNQSKYCLYHRDHDHDTEECIQLQDKIKEFIKRGRLGQFLRHRSEARVDRPRALLQSELPIREEQQEDRPSLGIIDTIFGGLSALESHHPSASKSEKACPKLKRPVWSRGGHPIWNLMPEEAQRNNAFTILKFREFENVLSVVFLQ